VVQEKYHEEKACEKRLNNNNNNNNNNNLYLSTVEVNSSALSAVPGPTSSLNRKLFDSVYAGFPLPGVFDCREN